MSVAQRCWQKENRIKVKTCWGKQKKCSHLKLDRDHYDSSVFKEDTEVDDSILGESGMRRCFALLQGRTYLPSGA